jgi:hypothetical protein
VPALAGCGDPNSQPADIPEEDLPHDDEGYLLRPGVVWFNENLDAGVADKVGGRVGGWRVGTARGGAQLRRAFPAPARPPAPSLKCAPAP